jgi:two-component system, OmpR family, response regulator
VVKPNKTIYENAMIVEDERDLSYLLAIVLKQNNISSACVYTIKEARENIKKIKPSIIFLDDHLPDGIGSDFISQAKEIYPGAKIVMITAHDSPAEMDQAFHRGADYFLSKPFNSSEIRSTLDLLMKKKQGHIYSHM